MAKPSEILKAASVAKATKKRALKKKHSKSFADTAKKMGDVKLAKAKGKEVAALTKLKPIAQEINERLVKASKLTSDAFDHRLAAAIRLEDASKMCKKAGVNFKKWAESNVTQSYETVRKLVAIGASDDPKLALEDLRISTRKAVAKHTAKKVGLAKPANGGVVEPAPSSAPSRTAWEIAEDMVASLNDKEQLSLITARANLIGHKVITAQAAILAKDAHLTSVSPQLKAMKEAFDGLKASAKMKFLKWAADEVGATVTSVLNNGADDAPIPEKGGIEVPDSMRR